MTHIRNACALLAVSLCSMEIGWVPVPRPRKHRRWGFGWVDKAQCFRSARRFGAVGSSPDFSRVFSRHLACRHLNLSTLLMYSQTSPGPVRVTDGESSVRELPAYTPCSELDFTWGNLSGRDFAHSIRCAYEEIVHWNRNMFHVPHGKIGKSFIRELTRLFNAFAHASAYEQIALDAAMVACGLLLQKPHRGSKASDHARVLDRRLRSWNEGDIDGLVREGRTIQRQQCLEQNLRRNTQKDDNHSSRTFAKLVFQGKIKSAVRFITENNGAGVLSLNDRTDEDGQTVLDVLCEKHPSSAAVDPEALIGNSTSPYEVHPVLFDQITGDVVRQAALRTEGSAGPSGVDAAGWRRMCTSVHREL